MKIVYTPDFPDNPYQCLLYRECARLGVQLKPVRGPWLAWQVLRVRPDLIHIHWLHPFFIGKTPARSLGAFMLFVLQWPLLRLSKARIVWTVHNLRDHDGRMRLAELVVTRLVSRAARRIITHCETARSLLLAEYPWIAAERTTVVPHGSYVGVYPQGMPRAAARRRLDLPTDARVVLFFGEVRGYKGVSDLIRLFADPALAQRGRLLIVGRVHDETLRATLEQSARSLSSVHLHLGFVADDDIQVYMAAADTVVTPFRNVLTSGSLLLGLSFGKALIAPRLGCATDLAAEAAGCFYDPTDPHGLASALRQVVLHADDAEICAMGARNLALAQALRWSAIAMRTLDVYEQALGND